MEVLCGEEKADEPRGNSGSDNWPDKTTALADARLILDRVLSPGCVIMEFDTNTTNSFKIYAF